MIHHWERFHLIWNRLGPPLRPDQEVADAIKLAIAPFSGRVLLLGVTPELADAGNELEAVDRNANMIEHVWPGDTPSRRARQGDWLNLNFPAGRFSAVIGDGALNNVSWPEGHRKLYRELARVLRPGGRFVSRVFARPDDCESPGRVCADARCGKYRSFHAFKWKLAMSLSAERGEANLPVVEILARFNAELPDRGRLGAATGWTTDETSTIDIYAESVQFNCFPTRSEAEAAIEPPFAHARWQEIGQYELAECCPLLTMERR